MRGQLSTEVRLRISITRLKKSNQKWQEKVKELTSKLGQKDKEIRELREKLADKEQQRKELQSYLYKPSRHTVSGKKPGHQSGAPAFHRPRPKETDVTEEKTLSLKRCPNCRSAVSSPAETFVRYEEDIDLAPRKIVRKYVITRHWCGHCETYMTSPEAATVKRIGLNVMGYILYARYHLRLPFGKIKESLNDLHNFKISEGEIAAQLREAENLFAKDYEAIKTLVQNAKVVYADETGWRMDGNNWWLWAFVTDKGIQYLLEDTRGKGVAERALGEKTDRVIVSDGYAVYKNLRGAKQQCWVHLLRKAKIRSPVLYEELAILYHKLLLELQKPVKERKQKYFADKLTALAAGRCPDPLASKVQERIQRHERDLLTCLAYENVLPENNTAERAIRPQVVMRKIFGGSRSPRGASAHAVNASVLATLQQQNPNQNFFDVLLPLIKKRYSEL